VYSESDSGLDAEWIFNQNNVIQRGVGKGIRISELNLKRRFEGVFEITYSDENGNKSPRLNLNITHESGYYKLIWKIGDEITDIGIGIEKDDKLFSSYKKTNEVEI